MLTFWFDARWSGGIGRRSRLKICRRSPGMGVQLPPPAPTLCERRVRVAKSAGFVSQTILVQGSCRKVRPNTQTRPPQPSDVRFMLETVYDLPLLTGAGLIVWLATSF